MKTTRFVLGAFALLVLVLLPLRVAAENIEVNPDSWDYGDVEVDTSRYQVFLLQSLGPTDLTVFGVEITDDAGGAYEITESTGIEISLPEGEAAEVEVTFTPPALGDHSAFLHIVSDAGGSNASLYLPLTGTGIDDATTPQELMTNLVEFFDQQVAVGGIYGRGRIPRIAEARLQVFALLLDGAVRLIDSGDYSCAVQVLERALLRADGQRRPRDFIAGEEVSTLYDMIEELIQVLETT